MIMANISTTTLPSQNDGCGSTPTYSRRERDDNYWGVIVVLNDRFRIIVCKNAIQFILQKRSVAPSNTGTWAGKTYTTTRDGLIAPCSERGLLSEPSAKQVLKVLPSDIRDYASQMGLPRARLDWPEGNDDAYLSNLREAAKAFSV
jgi:hypothetical protein